MGVGLAASYFSVEMLCSNCGTRYSSFPPKSYVIDEHAIQSVSIVVDLRVTVNNNLKFSLYINNVCCKAHKRYNLLLCWFQSKNVESLISRLTLEYCSVVWNPYLLKDIKTTVKFL